MKKFSVIICTYNPNPIILNRCLQAIQEASLTQAPTEIIIVDNNSSVSLADANYIKSFLQSEKKAKIIVEKKQGLTPARLLGIKEATTDLLVFIDDDNIIAPDFFSKGIEIAEKNLHIGAWSGQVWLEFEKEPEPWTKKYWGLLVYRKFDQNVWSNLPDLGETMPCGAGLYIRKNVADYYLNLHESGQRNIQLDRTGKSLFSGGDNDMAACACDVGLGVGLFHEIVLTHYIPSLRLQKAYLLKLTEGIYASDVVLKSYRGVMPEPLSSKNKIANILRSITKNKTEKAFFKAGLKGNKAGKILVQKDMIYKP